MLVSIVPEGWSTRARNSNFRRRLIKTTISSRSEYVLHSYVACDDFKEIILKNFEGITVACLADVAAAQMAHRSQNYAS